MAEELQPEAGRQVVALCAAAPLLEDRARTERVVELLRSPGAGMEGAGNEFPERLEVLEHGRVGIVMMRGGVVHVGGDPDRITDAGMLDEGEEIGDFDFAPSFLRTTPAKKPRTECCCQWVTRMMAAIVAPSGRHSMASTRACFDPGRRSREEPALVFALPLCCLVRTDVCVATEVRLREATTLTAGASTSVRSGAGLTLVSVGALTATSF